MMSESEKWVHHHKVAHSCLTCLEIVTSNVAWASGAAFGIYLGLTHLLSRKNTTKPAVFESVHAKVIKSSSPSHIAYTVTHYYSVSPVLQIIH